MGEKTSTAKRWKAIIPSDDEAVRIEPTPTSISVNVSGMVNIVGDDGHAEDFYVAAGVPLPCQPIRVTIAGTDAEGIRALYN